MRLYIQALSQRELLILWMVGNRKRPKFTVKMVGIMLTSILLICLPLLFIPKFTYLWAIIASFVVVVLAPFCVSISVGLWAIPSSMVERILLYLAGVKRAKLKNLIVIGVTGSYGKTSTKEAIADVLSEKYKVLRTPKSANGEIGVALHAIRSLHSSYEIYVVEMGAYYRGVIRSVAKAMKPSIGVLTGINEQHLGLFGNYENITKAKLELMQALPKDGVAIINWADQGVRSVRDQIPVRTVTYESKQVSENVNAAVCVARELGMTEDEISRGVQRVVPMSQHMQFINCPDGLTIIDDTYNSNSTGFLAALLALAQLDVDTRVVVTTGIYELGEQSQTINARLYEESINVTENLFMVEPLHALFYPTATVVTDSDILVSQIHQCSGSIAVLFEGRSRINNEAIELLRLHTKP